MTINIQLVKKLRLITQAGILDCKKALEISNGNIKDAIVWLRKKGIAKAIKKYNNVAVEGIVNLINKGNKIIIFEINSETDFVTKNKHFLDLIKIINEILIKNEPNNLDEALKILINQETLKEIITQKIAIIGENIIFRRFKIINLDINQSMGLYLHSNNKIASVLIFNGKINEIIGKQLAMHVSAMHPQFISKDDIPLDFLNKEKSILTFEIKNNQKNFCKSNNILEKIIKNRLIKQLAEISFLDQIFIFDKNKKINDVIKENNTNIISMIRYEVGEEIKK